MQCWRTAKKPSFITFPGEDDQKKAIAVLTEEISVLREYRGRLVADTVTGKIDVRGIEIPGYEFVEENIDTEKDESMEGMEGETYEE